MPIRKGKFFAKGVIGSCQVFGCNRDALKMGHMPIKTLGGKRTTTRLRMCGPCFKAHAATRYKRRKRKDDNG